MASILGIFAVIFISLMDQISAESSIRNVLANATVIYSNCTLHDLRNLRNQTFDPSGLIINHCYIPELPNAFFIRLKNLTVLELSESKLTIIDDFAFNGMPGLRSLNLAKNNISIIKSWSLEDMKNLTNLDLRRNAITEIYGKNFSRFPNLQKLNLASNAISDLQPNVFSNILNLKSLNLGRNALQTIGVYDFRGLTKLTHLDLHHNRIETIEIGAFDNVTNLRSLRLEGNLLTAIELSLIWILPHLGHLNVSHNLLDELPDRIFNSSVELKSLDLSYNRFQNISDKMFSGLEVLEMLNLSSNRLAKIDPSGFSDFSQIIYLDLSANRLHEIPSTLFAALDQVVYLNLSRNEILQLEETAFNQMNFLKILDLSNNRLFSEELLQQLSRNLEILDISGNFYRNLNLENLKAEWINLAGNPWDCSWLVSEMNRAPESVHFGSNYSVESEGEILNVRGIDCYNDLTKRSIVLLKRGQCTVAEDSNTDIPKPGRHHFVNFRLSRDSFDQRSVFLWLLLAVGIVFLTVKGGRALMLKSEMKSEQLRQMNQERILRLREYRDNPVPVDSPTSKNGQ